MEWEQFLILIISLFGMFIWLKNEISEDRRMVIILIQAVQDEIKDFHGRLCALEERQRIK